MTLSKPSFFKFDATVSEKLSKILTQEYNGLLSTEEIVTFCKITKEKPVSIQVIKHLLGGETMHYPVMELSDSHDCYQFCRHDMIKFLQETKFNIEFFEDRTTTDSNVIVSVVRKVRKNSKSEQISVMAVIRFTLFMTPKVGFCRYFNLTGKHVSQKFDKIKHLIN